MDTKIYYTTLIIGLLAALLLYGIRYLGKYLRELAQARIKDAETEAERMTWERRGKVFEAIEKAAAKAVTVVNQVFVDDLKKADKWTPEKGRDAMRRAIIIAKNELSDDIMIIAGDYVDDVEAFLEAALERQVNMQKDIVFLEDTSIETF